MFRCENALDSSEFAIKKIRIKSQLEIWMRNVLRITQTDAALTVLEPPHAPPMSAPRQSNPVATSFANDKGVHGSKCVSWMHVPALEVKRAIVMFMVQMVANAKRHRQNQSIR